MSDAASGTGAARTHGAAVAERAERRFQCVMNFEAFPAKTKSSGVCARQFSTAASVGVR